MLSFALLGGGWGGEDGLNLRLNPLTLNSATSWQVVLMKVAEVAVASELVAALPDRVQRNDASTSEQ